MIQIPSHDFHRLPSVYRQEKTTELPLKFVREDIHDYDPFSGYPDTNEQPSVHNDILGGLTFDRIGGICGGVDILINVLLHRCLKSAVMIDHAWMSLKSAERKLTNLLLTGRSSTGDLRTAYHRLHRVRIMHGDLYDLEKFGPFDLLYLSNALEHNNRDGERPDFNRFLPMLAPNGMVLLTQENSMVNPIQPDLSLMKLVDSRTKQQQIAGWSGWWNYYLYQCT